MTLTIDPQLFTDAAIPDDVNALNAKIMADMAAAPDMWQFSPHDIRRARTDGAGPFPPQGIDESAETVSIDGPHGEIELRIFRPKSRAQRGTYFHIHGGGWVLGSADGQDQRLREIAENCGLAVISVEYRLAPEHPFPKGPDDCYAAAKWLLGDQGKEFNQGFISIGGESAGAHLAAWVLLKIRDDNDAMPFHAANLVAGCFDMGKTHSAQNYDLVNLILTSRDMDKFSVCFLQNGEDPRAPGISPMFANLSHMPPALFSIGTRDILLDDSVMMAARWSATNGNAELAVFPGGCHVFQQFFETAQARQSLDRIDAFLNAGIDKHFA